MTDIDLKRAREILAKGYIQADSSSYQHGVLRVSGIDVTEMARLLDIFVVEIERLSSENVRLATDAERERLARRVVDAALKVALAGNLAHDHS